MQVALIELKIAYFPKIKFFSQKLDDVTSVSVASFICTEAVAMRACLGRN